MDGLGSGASGVSGDPTLKVMGKSSGSISVLSLGFLQKDVKFEVIENLPFAHAKSSLLLSVTC